MTDPIKFAEESPQLTRAREKLKASFEKVSFSEDELQKKVNQIKLKIDNDPHREVITEKSFTHFDGNKHPASLSRTVSDIANKLSILHGLEAKEDL